jgi:pimeloyl-ACP methyl ester carboxylesterase
MSKQDPCPVVLVHGFADDRTTWDPLLPHLGATAVHAWDLPGHGARSAGSAESMTRDAAVAELVGRIGALGRPVVLVGHSLGGYLTLMATIQRPDLVGSVVLISSGPGFRKGEARRQWNAYIDSIAAQAGMSEAVTALAYQPDSYVIDHLGSLTRPLSHVLGSRDRRYRAGADYVRSVLPSSELVEIDGAGHHPQRSHPQQVADVILARCAVDCVASVGPNA